MYNNFDFICNTVESLTQKYEEHDPFRLAKQMGVVMLFTPMGNGPDACKGFFLTHSRIKTMTINSDLSPIFQKIICAHELGHAVLHKEKSGVRAFHEFALFDSASTCEYEANIFAAELLLKDEDVLASLNDDLSFFQAAASLNVPAEILDFKFRTLKWKGYKVVDAPLSALGNWLKNAEDNGTPENLYDA